MVLDTKYKKVYLILLAVTLACIFERTLVGKVSFLLLICNIPLFFVLLLFPISRFASLLFGLLLSFLLPFSLITRGLLKASLLDVFISSNTQEAYEFYISLPLHHLIPSALLFLLFLVSLFCNLQINYEKSRRLILIAITLTVLSFSIFLFKMKDRLVEIRDSYTHLYTHSSQQNEWEIKERANAKLYNIYVVIVGESMRKDFMSLYDFNIETTPFIDQLPKKYIKNYIATAGNTALAVPRILSKTNLDGGIQEQNNAINLAKKAGYSTYWISSQGYAGKYNIASSRIAQDADFLFFKTKDDDFNLLPLIKEKIHDQEKKKVIFVQIMGSHESACHRLGSYGIRYNLGKGKMIDCYLSTYRKTDDFIKEIITSLKESGKSFSMSYFSDHGANFISDFNGFDVFRDDNIKQTYQIPFFVASSDDTSSIEIDVTRSAFHYLDFFASWIGVKTNMTIDNYDIFSSESDDPLVMSYDKKLIPYKERREGIAASDLFEEHKK